jgi:GPH family glycoside/pentoside/hexuronide:cation symporter
MSNTEKKLGGGLKLAYGIGLSAEGIKNNAFNLFLLFYYQQIVRLDPALCGLALFIALCVDSIADPTVGVLSDGLKSRLGRRHPFMYAASLPLALCYLAVFMPPLGASKAVLFVWLTVFAIGTRVSMAFFAIPHQSLVPELTSDSDERTSLMSLRMVFAWLFGLLNAFVCYGIFFAKTPAYPQGLLNPAGYPKLAVFGAVLMFGATLASSLGTNRAALRARPAGTPAHMVSLRELPKAIRLALRSASYRAAVLAGLFVFVWGGISDNIGNYMNTFFWGFTSEQLQAIIIVIFFASLLVLATTRSLAARFGKRRLGMASAAISSFILPIFIALRIGGVLNGSSGSVFALVMVAAFFGYSGVIMAMTVVGAMVADVTDEFELTTGQRQEGLLFAALSFINKAGSGAGVLATGLVIKLVELPPNATPATVGPDVARNLGLISAFLNIAFGIAMVVSFSAYRLDRTAHQSVLLQLKDRAKLAKDALSPDAAA